ncbi:MAG: gliding motility-associated C-terminal domain-containing protein, partial [Bacteroidia bacterium]
YISSPNYDNGIISVMHTPEVKGLGCNFQKNALSVAPETTAWHLPNLPNFDLGPIPLPACAAGPDHVGLPACRDTAVSLGGGAHNADFLYDWSPATGLDRTDSATVTVNSSTLAPGETRRYVLTVVDPDKSCRNVASDTVVVSRAALPAFESGPDISLCPDSTALIGANATLPGWFYQWSPETGLSDANIAMPETQPVNSMSYVLYAESPEGCAFYDTVSVELLSADPADCQPDSPAPGALFIPNIFTPNNDGINDRFVIPNLPPNSHLQVFDRWGVRVLERENYRNNWWAPGRAEGTYYYVLRLESGEVYKGWVVIMR